MEGKPNILFVFSDQQHWQALGIEDSSFETPNLDQLAKTATVFTHAFCTVPQCSPSRSSMLTGLFPTKTGVLVNLPGHNNIGNGGVHYMEEGYNRLRISTIGAHLQEAGYKTGYFGKWHLGKHRVATSGWDEEFGVSGPEVRDDAESTKRAISFLKRMRDDQNQPFALFISYNNPHDIVNFDPEKAKKICGVARTNKVELPISYHQKDLSDETDILNQLLKTFKGRGNLSNLYSQADWKNYRRIYRNKVKRYDAEFGNVLAGLNELGYAEDTLVVATSDHGDMDAHHRLMTKGPAMYDQLMRVPLIIRVPQSLCTAETPKRTDALVSNIDLAPTLAEYANTTLKTTDGISLKPLLSGETAALDRSFVIGLYEAKKVSIRMIRNQKYKYNLYAGYGEQLFDLANDPYELYNCADKTEYADVKVDLATKLTAWMNQNKVKKSNLRKIAGKGLQPTWKVNKLLNELKRQVWRKVCQAIRS